MPSNEHSGLRRKTFVARDECARCLLINAREFFERHDSEDPGEHHGLEVHCHQRGELLRSSLQCRGVAQLLLELAANDVELLQGRVSAVGRVSRVFGLYPPRVCISRWGSLRSAEALTSGPLDSPSARRSSAPRSLRADQLRTNSGATGWPARSGVFTSSPRVA